MGYIGQYEIDPYINHDAKWGICQFGGVSLGVACGWLCCKEGEREREREREREKDEKNN